MTAATSVLKHFNDLSPAQLYAIMRLRNEVFIMEQQCIYQDADGKDPFCHHLLLYQDKTLVAYARLLPAGLGFNEISIGRVVSSPAARGTGVGKQLMILAITGCRKLFGNKLIRIGAQQYAKGFYENLGFTLTDHDYDEDGIPHVEMILQPLDE